MPNLLHEAQGIRIVENENNRFVVVSLHYTADPAKCSEEWKREAKAGMRPARWEKEYELNYTALFGEKVWPQFGVYKHKIVVSDGIQFPEDIPCWGGFDYGPRNPSSFHIYLSFMDCIYSVWELFEPCSNLPAFAEKIKTCPYYHRIKYIAADPSIWTPTQNRDQGLVSIQELFREQGVMKFIKGNNRDEQVFVALLNKHWNNLEQDVEPSFKILSSCPNQIRELENAVYTDQSAKILNTKNLREDISDYNNHSIDDLKYFLLSRPQVHATKTITIPSMAKWWRT